jgi:hypothetical protein
MDYSYEKKRTNEKNAVKYGSRTHFCADSRPKGGKVFGRLVNLYVEKNGRWVIVGRLCSNCGWHSINGRTCCTPQHSNGEMVH